MNEEHRFISSFSYILNFLNSLKILMVQYIQSPLKPLIFKRAKEKNQLR